MSTTAPVPSPVPSPGPSARPTRRVALRAGAGASLAAGAAVAVAGPAAATEKRRKRKYRPGRYASTTLLSVPARHLVNRFSYGITPGLVAEVQAAGGHLAWFEQQLATAYDGSADDLCDWWPDLHRDAADVFQRSATGVRGGWEVMADYGRRCLLRRITSPRQVLEVMTEFWENHFHVPANADNVYTFRAAYGELIRQHALGRVEDLLKAAVLHPAMTFYLGAYASTKTHPNENLGRELLELHTVGLGSYTEDDVKSSARILTGYRIDAYKTWAVTYQPSVHWTGPVQVMGFSDPNADADGQAMTERYLSYLAHHPATARRIATKLGRQFVSDTPPAALVARLAQVYLDHDTAIVPVLQALVRSPEFQASVDAKVRDADEDIAAAYRLLGITITPPTTPNSAANMVNWQVSALGLAPFNWPRPDGQPVDNASWASPTRALASMSQHWGLVGGWWPKTDVTYRAPLSWLPQRSGMTFRDLVDHLSRLLLHRPSTESLLRGCCLATELEPTALITPASDLFTWRWPRLAAAIVDSPDFYVR